VTKQDKPDEIIEDLESLKNLFDEPQATADPDFPDVPVLNDALEEDNQDAGISADTFKALLDDTWQESVEEVLDKARQTIAQNSAEWFPDDTDELAQALKVRIDVSVKAWLAETLQANISGLRTHIVQALSEELLSHLHQRLGSKDPNDQNSDQTSDQKNDKQKDT